jgi:hypothetical protein
MAYAFFFNADEALHYFLSIEPSSWAVYQASLTTAHPPLFLELLHFWGKLGNSEFVLRIPSVVAGTAFCWMAYLWLKRIVGDNAALYGLALLLFAPPLVWLSAEVRQYALLWFFAVSSLYYFDCGVDGDSTAKIALSAGFLYLALLTHYSSFVFALAAGIYGLVRIWQAKPKSGVLATWVIGQIAAGSLIFFLLRSHVSKLKTEGIPQLLGDSYLRRSIYHSEEETLFRYLTKSNIRLFHYLFAQSAVGVIGLALFVVGIVLLVRRGEDHESRDKRRALAVLLVSPFVVNCVLGVLRLYPYGGTRHDSYLGLFAMSGIAVTLGSWRFSRSWIKCAVLAIVLLACNLFPAAIGEYIRPRDQSRSRMKSAINFIRSNVPSGSILFADDQARLLLSYYMCREQRIVFRAPFPEFLDSTCGGYRIIAISPDLWIFNAPLFAGEVRDFQQTFHPSPETQVWFFQSGWIVDNEAKLRAELPAYGCQQKEFGRNIVTCRLNIAP